MSEVIQKVVKWFRRQKKNLQPKQTKTGQRFKYEDDLEDAKFKFLANFTDDPLPLNVSSKDFEFVRQVGKGGFSDVFLVRNSNSNKYFALKVVAKSKITNDKEREHLNSELNLHKPINFPFIVDFKGHFQGEKCYYLLLEYLSGGTLNKYFGDKFLESHAKFYAANVFMALEFLHSIDVVYRDLKPENMLLDDQGYIKLGDLGFAKRIRDRTATFCGTSEYFPPEIYLDSAKKSGKGYGKGADWWTFGIFIFEMVTGSVPFQANSSRAYIRQINSTEIKYHTPDYVSEDFKDLISHLLTTADKRYGGPNFGYKFIQKHRWFQDVKWDDIYYRKATPPMVYRKAPKSPDKQTSEDRLEFKL